MDLEREYDNRSRVPEHPAVIEDWAKQAEAFRRTHRAAKLDQSYGARSSNRYDFFPAGADAGAPLVVFIHGGYWRSLDKTYFSHMAGGIGSHGFDVVLPTYTLCPAISIPEIIDELRQFCVSMWTEHRRHLVVTGHSAGGHLAAAMAMTPWEHYGAPSDLIKAGLAVSGIFDLRPLMATSLNADLKLNPVGAGIASVLFWPVPRHIPFDCWVGADESSEFLRQSASLVAAWSGLGLSCALELVEGANHFTVVNELARPESEMTLRLLQLAR